MKKAIGILVVLLMAASAQAAISVNFSGGWMSGPYPLSGTTGAVPLGNWNNWMTGAHQNMTWATSPALIDSDGNATTVTLTAGSPNHTQLQDDGPGPGNNSGGIQTLFYGKIRANTDGGPTTVYSTGMTGTYNLIVYASSNVTLVQGGGTGNGVTGDGSLGSGYVEGTNYCVFTGVSGDFKFTTGNAVYGLQIIPEPATMSLLVLGGVAALLRRKRR
ncbi:MAG: PEP-CTERM sorting domain-containing protein [Planctomycetota bacterium]|nr:PEP-CTERM sorting domain-containing protein [Planctomycetota bacterium]